MEGLSFLQERHSQRVYVPMNKKLAQQTTPTAQANQTPFERFKAVLARVVAVPKSSLPKATKKSRKK